MKFVIFHGAFGSPEGNWFPELKEKLESLGQEVIIPKFPVEDWNEIEKAGPKKTPINQSLNSWLKVFEEEYKKFKKGEKLCFIGHSLGPLFILHIVNKYNLKLDSAIFVSPFLTKLNKWQFNIVNKTFYKDDFDFEKLKKLIPVSYTLYSDNDPYVPKLYSLQLAEKLDSSALIVKNAGHMNSEVNLNEFPLVFELCKTRLDISLYQRYLAHRQELYSLDYTKEKNEEIVFLEPAEVFNEGVFHFRNLESSGFCTLFTGLPFWDTQSKYYEEARRAAKRVKNFIRIFITDKIPDLENPQLLKHIQLDIDAGIKTFLCRYEDIRDVTPDPDFGIWDNDYLCIVKFDSQKQINEVRLSSRRKEINEANEIGQKILKKSKRIYNSITDINDFIKNHSIL